MTKTDPGRNSAEPGQAELLEDWLTIWQSELSGMILDLEGQDAMLRLVDAWAQQARMGLRLMATRRPMQRGAHEPAERHAGSDAAARAAPAAAASDGRDAVIEQLTKRVAELERRVAGTSPLPGPARSA